MSGNKPASGAEEADRRRSPEEITRAYLSKEGFPLEFETAGVFRRSGLDVRQSIYVSKDGEQPRELDVMAVHTGGSVRPAVMWLVECKEQPLDQSARIPWAIFTGPADEAQPDVDHVWGTPMARAALWTQASNNALSGTPWAAPGSRGFGGRQCRKEDTKDQVYAAFQGLGSAASAVLKLLEEDEDPKLAAEKQHMNVLMPTIVLRGPLVEVSGNDRGGLDIVERPWIRVHWSGYRGSVAPMTVDVVTLTHLTAHLQSLLETIEIMEDAACTGREVVLDCLKRRTSAPARKARGLPEYSTPALLAGLPSR